MRAIRVGKVECARLMEDFQFVTTGNDFSGFRITAYLGIVRGIVVRSTGIAAGFMGGIRSMGGGNIPEYSAVCEAAREEAFQLMMKHAQEKSANAVIAFRYDATEFIQGSTEVLAYGTAVTVEAITMPPRQ